MDWPDWQKTVDYIVDQRGRWYGIGDADGKPLITLPEPTVFNGAEQWQGIEDIEVEIAAEGDWLDWLLMNQIDGFSVEGKLGLSSGVYTFLYATRDEDDTMFRQAGLIEIVTGSDPDNTGQPDILTIHALGTGDVWNTLPAISWPRSWWKADPYPNTSDEAGVDYAEPWNMARIELATRVSYQNKFGKAGFVIRRLIQESLDAAMSVGEDPDGTKWVDDPFHVVEVPVEDNTPEIALRAEDDMVWDAVQAQAQNSGLSLATRVWWPGDAPVRAWSQATSNMTPEQVDISPDDGSATTRTLEYQTWDHAMIILYLREVNNG